MGKENPVKKKVLLTSNGDDVSLNIAFHLAKYGCRSVLRFLHCFDSSLNVYFVSLILFDCNQIGFDGDGEPFA